MLCYVSCDCCTRGCEEYTGGAALLFMSSHWRWALADRPVCEGGTFTCASAVILIVVVILQLRQRLSCLARMFAAAAAAFQAS
jgi:hypothetical protein